MYKGLKARPHDLDEVMKMEPELIEIHASSEDLEKKIDKQYGVKLAVHLPEYDGTELLDPASDDEQKRLRAVKFYNNALEKSREWGKNFRGLPTKVILHPGGWSIEPMKKYERKGLYDNLYRTIQDLNTADIDLLIENMPPHPWFYGGRWHCNIFLDPKECRDYCLGWGVGLAVDICHSTLYTNYVKEIDPVDFLSIVKPVTAHVHFSDGKGTDGEGLNLGEGDFPLDRLIPFINKLNVAGVPEIWLGHKQNGAGAKKCWERFHQILNNGGTSERVNGNGTHSKA